jgi:hypothetical protein
MAKGRRSTQAVTPRADIAEKVRRSSAKIAYDIREIRSRILDHVDRNTLVGCMRLSQEGMGEIARRLYHTMTYNQSQDMKDVVNVSYPSDVSSAG